jgi:hypothetical protein
MKKNENQKVPYVCSCPGHFMGTYCEIPREQFFENDMNTNVSKSNSGSPKSDGTWRYANKKVYSATGHKFSVARATSPNVVNPFVLNRINVDKNINLTNAFGAGNVVTSAYSFSTPLPITESTKANPVSQITDFKEPACEPNPCLNNAKCLIISDSIYCKCTSQYSGKFCENLIYPNGLARAKFLPATFQVSSTTPANASSTTTPSLSTTFNPYLTSNDQEFYQTPESTSTRRYFWQCPSNCMYHLGRGYCALSSSGFPSCMCRNEFTGVDCGQLNYCLKNLCSNNSTCFNYPELK